MAAVARVLADRLSVHDEVRNAEERGHLFGALQTLVSFALIGHFVGIDDLGIWNLSTSLVMVPLVLISLPIAQVIYAAFARMRDNVERVAEVWLSGFTLLAALAFPVLFGLVALAPLLIPLVFGAQWVPAVPVIQILSVWVIAKTLQTWNTSVMDAAGKPHVSMILNAAVLIALPPSLWFGSHFGIAGVAVAFSLVEILFGELPSFVLTTRELSLKRLTVFRRIRGPSSRRPFVRSRPPGQPSHSRTRIWEAA